MLRNIRAKHTSRRSRWLPFLPSSASISASGIRGLVCVVVPDGFPYLNLLAKPSFQLQLLLGLVEVADGASSFSLEPLLFEA